MDKKTRDLSAMISLYLIPAILALGFVLLSFCVTLPRQAEHVQEDCPLFTSCGQELLSPATFGYALLTARPMGSAQRSSLLLNDKALRAIDPVTDGELSSLPSMIGVAPGRESSVMTVPMLEPVMVHGILRDGETVSSLLAEFLTSREIELVRRQSRTVFPLRKIRVGHTYTIKTFQGELRSFEYEINTEEKLVILVKDTDFTAHRVPIKYEVRTKVVAGIITRSLSKAVEETGEGSRLALELEAIFCGDVDFRREIRAGDSFKALIEKRYWNGRFAHYGRILAAELCNRERTYKAYLFEENNGQQGHYDAEGNRLGKAFLRAPLSSYRISSGFSMHRLHPIRKAWLPHPAIDYAAPLGTPVRVVGEGVIVAMDYDHSSGRYFKIQHDDIFETQYLHLSRFAPGLRKGKRVTRGQVIGYVGSTGLSTGPHLDFRMKKHGRYVDPRTITFPPAERISEQSRGNFETTVQQLSARLEGRYAGESSLLQ